MDCCVSTVFLFGAGASFGSGEVTPHPPPLGNGPDGLFRRMQQRGGIAATIEPPLAQTFENNFEAGMDEFAALRGGELVPFLREIGNYLRCFRPGTANHYRDIAKLAAIRPDIVLSTLNYDLLLERAVLEGGNHVLSFGEQTHPLEVRVLKPHGSVHFIPDVPPRTFRNLRVNAPNVFVSEFRLPIRAEFSEANLESYYRTEESLAPAMALCAPNKRFPVSGEETDEIKRRWTVEVERAAEIVVIGVAVNRADRHIWEPVARSHASLAYVGLSADQRKFEEWCHDWNRANASILADTFEDAIPVIRRMRVIG
jgi:hypothetical protein